MQLLRNNDDASEITKILMEQSFPDSSTALQVMQALARWRVFVLSNQPSDMLEELGFLPLENESELQRLIDSANRPIVIPSGSYAFCSE